MRNTIATLVEVILVCLTLCYCVKTFSKAFVAAEMVKAGITQTHKPK